MAEETIHVKVINKSTWPLEIYVDRIVGEPAKRVPARHGDTDGTVELDAPRNHTLIAHGGAGTKGDPSIYLGPNVREDPFVWELTQKKVDDPGH